MFDLNTIIINALNQAIAEATTPLIERIAELEAHMNTVLSRTQHQTANVNAWTSSDIMNIYARLEKIDTRLDELENRNTDRENVHDNSIESQLDNLNAAIQRVIIRLGTLEGQVADAITAEQVGSLIEDALSEIDWEGQVQDVLDGHNIEEQVKEAIDELIDDLRITRI